MASKIIFNYKNMDSTSQKISGYATQYEEAAITFLNEINTAIEGWEGDSKDKFQKFIDEDVKNYVRNTIPEVVEGLAEMLKSNSEQMSSADNQISSQLP